MIPIRRASPAAIAVVAFVVALAAGACGVPAAQPTPSPATVETPGSAADAVRDRVPLLDGIAPLDPDLVGQAAHWRAEPAGTGWRVTFEVGWGDCPAGCIDRHTWTWDVARDGSLAFVGEDGTPLPADMQASLVSGSTRTGLAGRATGGPTCPVEQPGDPACAARPVGGAELVVRGPAGTVIHRVLTDGSGLFRLALAPGDYILEAPTVAGYMSGPAPQPFAVQAGAETWLDLAWDTGIR